MRATLWFSSSPSPFPFCHRHSYVTAKGNLSLHNGVLDQIQHNTVWGQKSNLMSIPTDCPQRTRERVCVC